MRTGRGALLLAVMASLSAAASLIVVCVVAAVASTPAAASDRCPAPGAPGCPGATVTSGFPVRTTALPGGELRLSTGIEASCPRTGFACRGRARVSSPGGLTLGVRALRLRSGTTVRIALRLNARGVAALRSKRRIRARISVSLTGPDGRPVGVIRITTIRAP